MSDDEDDKTWGSVGGVTTGTMDGVPVQVNVAVSCEEDYRIAAWSKDFTKEVAITLDRASAERLRDALTEALKLGVWAV